MGGSVPNLRTQVAALLVGAIDLLSLQRWFASAAMKIERDGTDDDVDFSNRVENLLAEFTGDHISADRLIEALCREYELRVPERELASASAT